HAAADALSCRRHLERDPAQCRGACGDGGRPDGSRPRGDAQAAHLRSPMHALRRSLALIRKELTAILKHPRPRVVLFVPPILQSLLFGYAATFDLNRVPYALLDRDHSAASTELASRLDGSQAFERAANIASSADIAALINRRQALLVMQIPEDFERRLLAGQPAEVQVIADGRNSNTAGTALGYVNAIIQGFN